MKFERKEKAKNARPNTCNWVLKNKPTNQFKNSFKILMLILLSQTNVDLQQGIDDIGYSYGFTATGEAMKVVREEMFSKGNGDRENVNRSRLSSLFFKGRMALQF